jgi:hypothetical protein
MTTKKNKVNEEWRSMYGISRKADERVIEYKMRVNKSATLSTIPSTLGDKLSRKYAGNVGAVLNPVLPNQAMPVNHTAFTREGPYRTGDGDCPVVTRPGADDHKKHKSLMSQGEANYNSRGHK